MGPEENRADALSAVSPVHHEILPRKGIAEIIDGASAKEAVYIVAPYGCGKTLAVASWLAGRRALWLELDESAVSEKVFINRLVRAVLTYAGVDPIRHELLSGLGSDALRAFALRALLRAGSSNAENILVIDNFRFVRSESILRFVKDVVSECLGSWRIVIISRTELPPVFNDLMLKKRICLVTLRDLGFSAEETQEYFRINGADISPEDAARLRDETEGWPAALNAVLAVSRGGPAIYGEDARSYVTGFFETEIWQGINNSLGDFLLKTSVLEILTPSACHAVTEMSETLPILKGLFVNGLFISRLDERDTYRYHRVFRDFLLDKLQTSDIDERGLNMKVAWWYYERNEAVQSFPYFLEARDMYGLSRVLRILNPAALGIEGFLRLAGGLTKLDIAELKPYPVIAARIALIHYLSGNVSEMQALYDTFIKWIEPGVLPISPEEYAEYVWEAGWLCYLNPDEEVRNNKKHEEWTNYREYVPHLEKLHTSRGAVFRFPSILKGIRDYCSVVDVVEEFARNADGKGESSVREEVSLWEIQLIIAEYAYETENFKKAAEITRRIMALVEERQLTDLCFVCTALLAKILRAVQGPREIGPLTDRLETMIMNNGENFLLPNFHAFQLKNSLAGGYHGFTEAFTAENAEYEDKPYFFLLYRHLAFARGFISTGEFNRALLILGNLRIMCQKYKRTIDMMEVNILSSVALYGLGNVEDSCSHLSEALNEAQKYGFIRIFSDDAKELWPVLNLLRKQAPGAYIEKVIISCKKTLARTGQGLSQKKYIYSELTKTELKILKSLQAGMSYNEIALDCGIRISTVKSHVHSIYSKLDVSNKTSAIIKGQSAGLLK